MIAHRFKVGASEAQASRWQWGSYRLGCRNTAHFLAASADFVCTRLERAQKRFEREEERRAEQRRKVLQEEAGKLLANWPEREEP